ncbi:MAG: hypothetical protein K2N48_13150, partial [Muribaculaceae bacterium]|nr:hypothetical protein [Muribaculaceae bacterium]
MKIVIGEWLKCKKATLMLLMFIVCNVVWYAADAYMLVSITHALNDGNLEKGLLTVGVLCMIRTAASMLQEYFEHGATHNCFESLHNRLTDKLLDAEYDMFTKFSVSKVTTLSQFTGDCTHLGKSTARTIIHLSRVLITLFSMYVIAGDLILPIVGLNLICVAAWKFMFKKFDEVDQKR